RWRDRTYLLYARQPSPRRRRCRARATSLKEIPTMRRVSSGIASPACLTVALAAALGLAQSPVLAQLDDHPADKPIQAGTDFGIAPFVIRTPSGPEGFSIDMVKEVARRIGRPGADIADMHMSRLI